MITMPEGEIITIQVEDAEVEDAAAKIEMILGKKDQAMDVKDSSEEAKQSVDELKTESDRTDIKGTNLLVRRTIAQIPGVREAYHLVSLFRTMLRVSPEIAFILAAWMAGRSFIDWLTSGAREAADYKKMVMEARGMTRKSEFDAWLSQDKARSQEAYRSAVPP